MIIPVPVIRKVSTTNENRRGPTCASISEAVKNARIPTIKQMIPGNIHAGVKVFQPKLLNRRRRVEEGEMRGKG